MESISILNQNNILPKNNVQSSPKHHIEIIDGATYEVTSNYVGDVSILDIFKKMLKRDIERMKG